jgi:RND family efflux transporter MFP subunit
MSMTDKRSRNASSRQRVEADADNEARSRGDGPLGDGAALETRATPERPSAAVPAPPPEAPQRRARRGGRQLLLLLFVVGAGALGYRYWGFWETNQPPPAAPSPPAVTVAKPLVKDLMEWSDFTGQFEALESVEIRPRVSGYLESINFTDGQPVKKGDLLFVIEPRPFEIALEQAKAQLAQANAQLDLAQAQLKRTAELVQKDYATHETYDERVAQVNTQKATRDAAIATIDQAQLNLDYTRVTAPVSGRIGRHEVSVGNLIMGGTGTSTTLLTTIVSLDPIWLIFTVSEGDGMRYKRLVQKGEIKSARDTSINVEGQLMDEDTWSLKGTIDFVDNQYDRASGTIRVRARFPNPNLFITAGQFGRVRVPMSQKHPTLLVPEAAVVTDQSMKLLFTVAADGTVVPKPVELGQLAEGGLRIIRSGIDANDQVVINGLLRARPGQKVTPQPGTISAPVSLDQAAGP